MDTQRLVSTLKSQGGQFKGKRVPEAALNNLEQAPLTAKQFERGLLSELLNAKPINSPVSQHFAAETSLLTGSTGQLGQQFGSIDDAAHQPTPSSTTSRWKSGFTNRCTRALWYRQLHYSYSCTRTMVGTRLCDGAVVRSLLVL